MNKLNQNALKTLQDKKDTEKKKSNIGVTFLTDQLLDVQVKLMEIDNCPETRCAEDEADEVVNQSMK